jgi:renalase
VRIVVVGAGMAGLTAARLLLRAGCDVAVLDDGRSPGGRLATRALAGGARADSGAQFFTVRSEPFAAAVAGWVHDGVVHEWCRGFGTPDGFPRYAARTGMASLGARLAEGLDIRSSVRVDAVRPAGSGWEVTGAAGDGTSAGPAFADAVVLTAPVPQSAALVAGHVEAPNLTYTPTLALLVALGGPPAVPPPGGVQLVDDPVWSWVGDNAAKGTSDQPAVTLHTRADVASARFDDETGSLMGDLLAAALPWLGDASITDASVDRWRYATPAKPLAERCLATAGGRVVFAGDAFGCAKVEGAFLSGTAAAEVLLT